MMSCNAPLIDFIGRHARLFVLTGAGCSTDSGIPDYRDGEGAWKRTQPMTWQAFVGSIAARRRYWARSLLGWPHFKKARPNGAHAALARLEQAGRIEMLVTQNVDRLHQAAGSDRVIDLHGRLDRVRCLQCGSRVAREAVQERLIHENPAWSDRWAQMAPDGDADLDERDFADFLPPACSDCGGIMKPDVVFFGENVPSVRVEEALRHLRRADAVLVIGSSLMVYSGFRFVRWAAEAGKPIAAVNLGRTRADVLLEFRLAQPCARALAFLSEDNAVRGMGRRVSGHATNPAADGDGREYRHVMKAEEPS